MTSFSQSVLSPTISQQYFYIDYNQQIDPILSLSYYVIMVFIILLNITYWSANVSYIYICDFRLMNQLQVQT